MVAGTNVVVALSLIGVTVVVVVVVLVGVFVAGFATGLVVVVAGFATGFVVVGAAFAGLIKAIAVILSMVRLKRFNGV